MCICVKVCARGLMGLHCAIAYTNKYGLFTLHVHVYYCYLNCQFALIILLIATAVITFMSDVSRQLYEVAIQAAVGKRVIARET